MEEMIYLDNAATTYPKPEAVYVAMDEVNRSLAVNAGRGSYALAQQALNLIAKTRNMILEEVQANDVAEVVFTASATIACNEILGGISWKNTDVVYVSPFEHNAVIRALQLQKERFGFRVEELAMSRDSLALDPDRIAFQFAQCPPSAVIMSHVSNVTGYILPLHEVLRVAESYGAVTVVDASQAFGLVPVDLRDEPIDFYVFAGHKTPYGPFGIGGFINNRGKALEVYLAGGTGSDSLNLLMPEEGSGRYEPGSLNVAAIAGLQAGLQELRMIRSCLPNASSERSGSGLLLREQKLTQYLVEELGKISGVHLYLPPTECHTGIVAFNIHELLSEDTAMILDEEYNIAVRAGYHCAPLIHKYIHNPGNIGVVRASLGIFTTKEQLDSLVHAVREIAEG